MAYKSPALSYFEWQQPVIDKDLVDPPGGETKGDRYLIDGVGINAWAGEDGNIATYNGAGWDFTDKREGMFVYVIDENVLYLYIAAWAVVPFTGDVTAALNLTDLAVVRGDGGAKGVKTSAAIITDAGEMYNPLQPAFLAYNSASDVGVTGDGTNIDPVEFDTEIYDQGGNFAGSIFTAPITGRYYFSTFIHYSSLLPTHTLLETYLVTSNRTYRLSYINPTSIHLGGDYAPGVGTYADMDANDTAKITTKISNGTKVITIFGNAVLPYTLFGGVLVC